MIAAQTFVQSENLLSPELIWKTALEVLSKQIPQSTFEPWVEPLEAGSYEGSVFCVKTGQSFAIQMLQRKYYELIGQTLSEILNKKIEFKIVFDEAMAKKKKASKAKEEVETEKRFENHKQMQSSCNLDLKYTFENFVWGENSKFAYEVAKIVAQNPGKKYNPLFIYGSVGLGKTHLMQAVGHYLILNNPELRIKFVKTEEFTNQLVESLKKEGDVSYKMNKFRERFRNVDVLLFDDIQFIEGKRRTFEEVFNTFEALHNKGKQIIFTSDKPPQYFENIEERLKSRFEWGISVEIKVPDYETRKAIVKNHAKFNNFELNEEVYDFLAQTFNSNVRELEGAYNQVSTWASIFGEELTLQKAKEILKYEETQKEITIDEIVETCANRFNVSKDDIQGTSRNCEIVIARQASIYLTKELTKQSLSSISKAFNKKHTTIMYSLEKIKKEFEKNPNLLNIVKEIKSQIYK